MFFTEFAEYLEITLAVPDQLLFTGDFNFHMYNKDDVDTIKFGDLLTSSGLQQHVHGATHALGHTLDLGGPTRSFVSTNSVLEEH